MRDAARLELVEEGAYRRLIDAYYVAEGPLPADRRECYKLAGAFKPAERKAVDYVLGKFFDETPDGFRHKRCDLEIARFRDKQNKAKASAESRWNAKRTESGRNANASPDEHSDAMRTHSEGNAHQTPDTRHQSPELKTNPKPNPTFISAPEAVGLIREAGIAVANPGHPKLVALCALGITAAELRAAVDTAKGNGKGFQYAVAVAANARNEASGNATTRPPNRADKLAATAANLGSARHAQGKGTTYEH